MPSALSVIALSERGTMFDPGPCVYMEKIADGPARRRPDQPRTTRCEDVIRKIAERKGGDPGDVTVIMLDRPRHEEAVETLREVGARIRFISDGDVAASLFAVMPNTGIDLLWGVGGTPEGVLSAAAIKCLGGRILGRLWPRNDDERQAAIDAGYDLDRVLDTDDLVRGRRRLLRRDRRHRRRPARRRALPRRRPCDDRVAGDALALGHRAPGAGDRTTARSCAKWLAGSARLSPGPRARTASAGLGRDGSGPRASSVPVS